jgi:Na+/H+ antiporter NhaA
LYFVICGVLLWFWSFQQPFVHNVLRGVIIILIVPTTFHPHCLKGGWNDQIHNKSKK